MICVTHPQIIPILHVPVYSETKEGLDILVEDGISGFMSAKIQSRHGSGKQHKCCIRYSHGVAGVNCVIWYVSYGGLQESINGIRHQTTSLEDAADIPEFVAVMMIPTLLQKSI